MIAVFAADSPDLGHARHHRHRRERRTKFAARLTPFSTRAPLTLLSDHSTMNGRVEPPLRQGQHDCWMQVCPFTRSRGCLLIVHASPPPSFSSQSCALDLFSIPRLAASSPEGQPSACPASRSAPRLRRVSCEISLLLPSLPTARFLPSMPSDVEPSVEMGAHPMGLKPSPRTSLWGACDNGLIEKTNNSCIAWPHHLSLPERTVLKTPAAFSPVEPVSLWRRPTKIVVESWCGNSNFQLL